MRLTTKLCTEEKYFYLYTETVGLDPKITSVDFEYYLFNTTFGLTRFVETS